MKKLLSLAAVVAIAFTACKKEEKKNEDTPNVQANQFTYDGTNTGLEGAIVDDYGIVSPGVYNLDITLVGEGINIVSPDSATGEGALVYFEVFTSAEGAFTTGTYSFDTTEAAGTFDIGEYVELFNTETQEESGEFAAFVSGSLEIVSYSASNMQMNFSGTLDNGKTFSGTYSGSFYYEDLSDFGISTREDKPLVLGPNL